MDTLEAQQQIVANVKARGFWDDLPPWAIACRQIPKLIEEVGEAARPVHDAFDCNFLNDLRRVEASARVDFRDLEGWLEIIDNPFAINVAAVDWQKVLDELADIQVVLCNAWAAILAHVNGDAEQEYDLLAAAVRKSEADIPRGTA